uniref:hypothetical protein n=1 Tax=Ramaria rubella TaxID=113071 RepID=UPI0022390155
KTDLHFNLIIYIFITYTFSYLAYPWLTRKIVSLTSNKKQTRRCARRRSAPHPAEPSNFLNYLIAYADRQFLSKYLYTVKFIVNKYFLNISEKTGGGGELRCAEQRSSGAAEQRSSGALRTA